VLEERKDDERELGATVMIDSVSTLKPWPDGAARRGDEDSRLDPADILAGRGFESDPEVAPRNSARALLETARRARLTPV
jgi:hypothetical protein